MNAKTNLSKEKLPRQLKKKCTKFSLFPTELLLVTDTVDERSDEIPTRYEAEGIFSFINCSMQ